MNLYQASEAQPLGAGLVLGSSSPSGRLMPSDYGLTER